MEQEKKEELKRLMQHKKRLIENKISLSKDIRIITSLVNGAIDNGYSGDEDLGLKSKTIRVEEIDLDILSVDEEILECWCQ